MRIIFGWPLFLLGLVVLLVGGNSLLAVAGYPAIEGLGLSASVNFAGPTYIRNLTTGFYGGVFVWLGFAMVFGSAAILSSNARPNTQEGEK